MVFRSAAPLLLLLVSASAFAQTPAQPNPNLPRVFHDPALAITYFYPGRFTPAQPDPPKAEATQQCVRSTLSGSSTTPVGTSAFVLSSIDSTCPNVLRGAAQQLDAFTREQVLRQLKQFGTPVITHEPTSYSIDGHPAAVTFASVQHAAPTDVNNIAPRFTYAAKACMLGNIPEKHSKSNIAEQTKHVLCFDFTTYQRDLLPLMLAFTVQFGDHVPQPIVPGGVLR